MRSTDKLLFDIADACRLVTEFVRGMDRDAFEQDAKTQSAVLYRFAIIGEASKNLPDEWRKQHPEIPWSQISRMRDHLIHRYFSVDMNDLWDSATVDIPILAQFIAPYVTPLLNEDEQP